MKFGYARVSREDQHTEQQVVALEQAGCERIFTDHGVSGSKRHRPQLDRLLDQLREGDVVLVSKLDRLGRSLTDLIDILQQIEESGAGVLSLAEKDIDTTTPAGKLIFRIFAVVAEFERDRQRERTNEGLARAKAQGTRLGRRPQLKRDQMQSLADLRKHGYSYQRLADTFGVSKSTVARYLSVDGNSNSQVN